jgi:hypothetical protein
LEASVIGASRRFSLLSGLMGTPEPIDLEGSADELLESNISALPETL